jgi:peroxiredoxin
MAAMSLAGVFKLIRHSLFGSSLPLKAGDLAPDFEANDQEGRKVALRDYRGRNLVLWFYPKADTPG